ncbi:MAG: molybdopterin molybdenumtransferase MoeA [Chitinophagaceae bacterium]|nr:MAG: molybdopterin molybdenumtransferase MoeA [Chitinophagaceae bacterium]
MIPVSEAKSLIRNNVNRLPVRRVAVENSAGLTLAEDVIAPFDIPSFYQSSMDGYAVAFDTLNLSEGKTATGSKIFRIAGESAAGNHEDFVVLPGDVARIFTGAPLPSDTDTIIIQERTEPGDGGIRINDHAIEKAQFVRAPGAEIRADEVALSEGHLLTPASVSYLASIGVVDVVVYPSPLVTVVVTGNEFIERGRSPQKGKVFESNSIGLTAALRQAGVANVRILYAADTIEDTVQAMKKACSESNLVLFTGGVSVGDYDFVAAAAEACGIAKIFHRVAQKPGKPLYFGKREAVTLFGLPGNPSSVLTCFYEYVLIAIQQLTGRALELRSAEVMLKQEYRKPSGLMHFLKAYCENGLVATLSAQESFKLSSFATANCLVVLPEETTVAKIDETVTIHWLP